MRNTAYRAKYVWNGFIYGNVFECESRIKNDWLAVSMLERKVELSEKKNENGIRNKSVYGKLLKKKTLNIPT